MVFSSDKKIKISKELYEQLEKASAKAGYSSAEELIKHVLEREVAQLKEISESSDQEEAERQLRGLGYLE